ncbi:PAS domain S-box protein [Natrinema ejinorense]|uniref:histidine kinase n=1 Tax=Natrinema ejinorense TaxID=373386 RepID=A0A2A5QZD4_9EURY|nr:PAS domain S-box protein [Natrinema ejinorense]PCR92133.1 histidine kinase [Natrinema ejinorense]
MGSSSTDADHRARLHRQAVVADLSQQALETGDLDGLLEDAAAAVAATLDVEYCAVLERPGDGTDAVLKQGAGWPPDRLGSTTVAADRDSQIGTAIRAVDPVVIDDFDGESRASLPEPLGDRDAVSAAAARIGPVDEPWGVLSAYAIEQRVYTDDDVDFLERVADVLGSAIETDRARRELERTERRFEAIFEDPNILVGLLEPDGTVVDINGTAMEYIDADPDDVTGEPFWETPWWSEDDVQDDVQRWTERAAAGEYVTFQADLTRPDGQQYALEGVFRPVTDEAGEVTSVIVSDRDVTERKERERQLSTLMDNVPGMVYRCENEHGWPMAFVSDACGELTGYEPAALESGELSWGEDVMVQADRETLWETVQRVIDEKRTFSETYRIETADGERRWVRDYGRGVFDDEGNLVDIEGIVADITERKQLESELAESEQRYRTLVEQFPNGAVALVDEDLCYRTVGGTPLDVADATAAEIEGQPVREAVPSSLADELVPRYEAALEGNASAFEMRSNGRVYDIQVAPVRDDDGDVFAALGMSQDVTERYEYERQLEESEQRYRTLIDHFPNGAVGLFDENLRYQIVGGSAFDEIDDSTGEIVGTTLQERYPPEVAERLKPRFEAALEGETASFEIALHDRDWIAHTVPVTDEEGEIFAGMVMVQDITERKEHERELRERERRLEESERRYRTLTQRFPNGAVGVYDRDLEYTLAEGSELGETLPPGERLEGNRLPEIFPEQTVADLESLFRAAVEDGETGSAETTFDGRHWRVWATPLRDAGGEIFAGLSFTQDVTEQVERENRLERYETIVEVVNDGVYVVDEQGQFTMVNETYAEMLGYEPADLVGEHVSRVVDDDVIDRVRELEATATEDTDWSTMEAQLRTADGDLVPVEANFAMLPDDDSAWHRVGITRDISERKARERELEESERRYRTLVENFPKGAVGLYDEDLEYIVVGGEAFDDRGVSEEEVTGVILDERHPDDLVAEIEPHFRAVFDGESNTFEYQARGRDIWAHTVPVRNEDDEIFAGMVMVQDVTERREYERKLEESNERLERFAYAASHDLQEPLRMVTSYLTLLENRYGDAFDEDGREFLAFAVDGAERMREMIDGLLKYSRVETEGDPFEPTDPEDLVDDVLADLQFRIEETDAEITVGELPRVGGDASQLRQVFQNLLSNAITYRGDDPPRVHVDAERRGQEWVISVADEGIGIDPDDQERVFTIFNRLHSREEYDGTGIGLALSERIVERHGGEIWVDAEPGEGSTFSFTMPASRTQ